MDDFVTASAKQGAVGEKVKTFRTARRMSLRALGEATGTTASFLSQLERGLSGVNISTLMRIAEALGISLTDLFEDAEPPVGRVLRKAERPALPPAEGYRKMLLTRRPIRDMSVPTADLMRELLRLAVSRIVRRWKRRLPRRAPGRRCADELARTWASPRRAA